MHSWIDDARRRDEDNPYPEIVQKANIRWDSDWQGREEAGPQTRRDMHCMVPARWIRASLYAIGIGV